MDIGIPREIKVLEGRIALTPAAVATLINMNHKVFIERNAGVLSGYPDSEYLKVGAIVVDSAKALYASATLIVKVKEPQEAELKYLRKEHILFSFLHLAAVPKLTQSLLNIGLTAIAFESVSHENKLPLLAPMSDIAGRIAVQIGSHLLHQPQGGRGILLGGVSDVSEMDTEKGNVVILGGGVAGMGATQVAAALGANVLVIDPNKDIHSKLQSIGQNVSTCLPETNEIDKAVKVADLLIGAVLIPGAKAPHLVSAEQVKTMKAGSVIIDISVDQGGCIETTHPTNYEKPTFIWEDVIHFGVTNMPGAVPRTATQALSKVLMPYVARLCEPDWQSDEELRGGINVKNGEVILEALL